MTTPKLPADLIAALLASREDPATGHFDRILAAAQAQGRLDEATARELRFWQRQSLESLTEHAAAVLPAAIAAREASDAAAREAVAEADLSWQQAATARAASQPTSAAPGSAPGAGSGTGGDDGRGSTGAAPRRASVPGLSVVSDDDTRV